MNAINKLPMIAALALAAPLGAMAATISGNVSLTTDYKFRGISQTDTSPAVQGGFDVAWDNGFYVGAWGSNVDFAKSLELDYYGGYAGSLSEDVGYDVGLLYYDYPGTPETARVFSSDATDDYLEIYGSFSWKDLTLGVNYSDDYYLETGKFWYLYGDYSIALPGEFSLGLHIGQNELEFADNDSNPKDAERAFLTGGADDYLDYSISLSKEIQGVELSLSWVDTDLDKDECFGSSTLCDGSLVFAISKSL